MTRVIWLLEIEKRPRTLNSLYYADYRDKFLAHYHSARSNDSNSFVDNTSRPDLMSQVLSGLTELGIAGIKSSDLPKLLPSDPSEPALHIMAAVRAYFQGNVVVLYVTSAFISHTSIL